MTPTQEAFKVLNEIVRKDLSAGGDITGFQEKLDVGFYAPILCRGETLEEFKARAREYEYQEAQRRALRERRKALRMSLRRAVRVARRKKYSKDTDNED